MDTSVGRRTGERSRVDARQPVMSVIIPAHDEEAVIGRLLEDLTTAPGADRLEVIVACNGCRDATATVARGFGVTVVETDRASKTAALNQGDAAASSPVRCYLDADVRVTGRALLDVAAALASGECLHASPPARLELSGRPWSVRAYHRIWSRTYGDGSLGTGLYALAPAGRARFDAFPPVTNDDLYARLLFGRAERRVVATDPVIVEAPWTLRDLLRRRIRIHAGNLEVLGQEPYRDLPGAREHSPAWWRAVLADPRLLPAAVPYAAVNGVAKLVARRRRARGAAIVWGRDESTRRAA
jgi:glycosyltransferase involved in cell wall biosynthesis